jgi:hypothetical protein
VAEVSDAKLPEVMALDEMAMLAVTVPLIAGREPIVTLFPTVTEEMLMGWVVWKKAPETGTVPEIDAVTEPICAVPATRAGRLDKETGWVV